MRNALLIVLAAALPFTACTTPRAAGNDAPRDSAAPSGQHSETGDASTSGAPTGATANAPAVIPDALVQRATATLDRELASPDSKVRAEALAALGLSKRQDALTRLEQALASQDGQDRFGAARGLRYLGDDTAGFALLKAWDAEVGWAVKKEMALTAGALKVQEFVPHLKKIGSGDPKELRVAAAWALKDLGDPAGDQALEALGKPERKGVHKDGVDRWSRKVLKGEKDGDRVLAIRTLAEVGTADDAELLGRFLDDASAEARAFAAAGILRHAR